jgi:hypothetical protein
MQSGSWSYESDSFILHSRLCLDDKAVDYYIK